MIHRPAQKQLQGLQGVASPDEPSSSSPDEQVAATKQARAKLKASFNKRMNTPPSVIVYDTATLLMVPSQAAVSLGLHLRPPPSLTVRRSIAGLTSAPNWTAMTMVQRTRALRQGRRRWATGSRPARYDRGADSQDSDASDVAVRERRIRRLAALRPGRVARCGWTTRRRWPPSCRCGPGSDPPGSKTGAGHSRRPQKRLAAEFVLI